MGTRLTGFDGLNHGPNDRLVRTKTRVSAWVYPQPENILNPSRSTSKLNFTSDTSKTEGSVIGMDYSHVMGNPAADFSLTIKLRGIGGIDIERGDIGDGDWIDIQVERNGLAFPLLRGVIDVVNQTDYSSNGVRVRIIRLSGRSHGALFESVIAWNNAYVQTYKEIVSGLYRLRMEGRVGGSPSDHFQILFDATFNASVNPNNSSAWELPKSLQASTGKRRFGELCYLDKDHPQTQGIYYNELQLWTNPGDTLHQSFSQWCNPMLNEWYYDLAPYADVNNKKFIPYATIRERPFINTVDGTNSPFFTLKNHKIPRWILGETPFIRGGQERVTVINVDAEYMFGNSQIDRHAAAPPLISVNDARYWGIKPLLMNTRYYLSAKSSEWPEARLAWQRRLADWFGPNPYFVSSTPMAKPILPEIRIGETVTLLGDAKNEEKNLTFYVEGVNHSFRFTQGGSSGTSAETRLNLTRGLRGNQREQVNFVRAISRRYTEALLTDTP